MEWMDWSSTGWPDWLDDGKRVEIERNDGTIIAGTLKIDDYITDGEGDEFPIFAIISDDGMQHSFADHKRWRFSEV